MKLYVSSLTEIINKERAESILREVGITKKIDGFSDCKNNCCCHEFKNGLEIRFDSFKKVDELFSKLKRIFLNPIKNLFIPNREECFITFQPKLTGFFKQESKNKSTIYLLLDKILNFNENIYTILNHEIMHIKKPIGHCDKLYCIFHNDYKGILNKEKINQVDLCEDCKKIYNEILEEINREG